MNNKDLIEALEKSNFQARGIHRLEKFINGNFTRYMKTQSC